jgi:hypothetical protein
MKRTTQKNILFMFKKYLLISLLISTTISLSQEIINSTPVALKNNRDVFQIVNETQKNVTLFVSDKERVKAISLNQKMKITDSISSVRPDKKTYTEMIGYNQGQTNSRLFWASSNYKEISSQLFDFETRKVSSQNYKLPLKNELFLQKFTEKEKFYILTMLKKTNILKLYVFDDNGKIIEKLIDLTGSKFYTPDYQKTNLYGILEENFLPFEPSFSLQKIESNSPTSLTYSAKKRKLYHIDNAITLTFDTNLDYTQVITINLKTFAVKETIIKKPFISFEYKSDLKSNSFLFQDKLYQIKTSSEKFFLNIKNLNDSISKEYSATNNKSIDFKNSEIIQENGGSNNKRILETSTQFIRKLNNTNTAISCYQMGDKNLITIGSVSEIRDSNAQILSQFGLIGSLVAIAISNPTMESFNSYMDRKLVKIDCLFDKDGNHISGEVPSLAFDKIRYFLDQNKSLSSLTLFKFDESYYLGSYDDVSKKYLIRKFND